MLTKKRAIKECKEVWKFVYSGKAESKYQAIGMLSLVNPKLADRIFKYDFSCPLCKYTGDNICQDRCPLYTQLGIGCSSKGIEYNKHPNKFAKLVMELKEDE